MSKSKAKTVSKPKAQAKHKTPKRTAVPKKVASKGKDLSSPITAATQPVSSSLTSSAAHSSPRVPRMRLPSFWQIMNPIVTFTTLFIIIFGGLYVLHNYESPAAKDMIEREIVTAFSEVRLPPSYQLTADSTGGKEILMQLNRTYVYTTSDSQEAAFHVLRESLKEQNFVLANVQSATDRSSLEAVGVINKSPLYLTVEIQANPTIIVINAHR